MLILFSLAVMRMSGAVALNPVFGRTNYPSSAKAALALMLALILYLSGGGVMAQEPESLLEYGMMLLRELAFGAVIGYCMELSVLVIRFSSSVMEHLMGLSMAQIYDPQNSSQVGVFSQIYYFFFMMLFFATDGHLRFLDLIFGSAKVVPLGAVTIGSELSVAVLEMFSNSILLGLQFVMPLMAIELIVEVAMGVIMRMIPGINVFTVNIQVKISVGLVMLWFLFSPMSDKIKVIIEEMFQNIANLMQMM